MGELVIGILCCLLAVGLEAYRQFCKFLDVHLGGYAGPAVWRSRLFQKFSSVVVVVCGVIAAMVFAAYLELTSNEFEDFFLFGFILVVQWLVALVIGRYFGKRDVTEHNRLLILRGGK